MPYKNPEDRRAHYAKNRDRFKIAARRWRQDNIALCREMDRKRDRKPYNRAWRIKNLEHVKAKKKQWNLSNPEKVRAMKRKYYSENKARLLLAMKKTYQSNKDVYYSRARAWKKRNPDKEKAYQQKWANGHKEQIASRMKRYNSAKYIAHPEILRARSVAFYHKNKESYRIKRRSIDVHRATLLRQYTNKRLEQITLGTGDEKQVVELIFKLRSSPETKCYYCHSPLAGNPIHIDHIIPLSRGGRHCVENLCASCPPCNLSKNNKTVEEWGKWKRTVKALATEMEAQSGIIC